MSDFDAITVLGNIAAQMGTPKLSKKPYHEILNEEEMNAARALYEIANGLRTSVENGGGDPASAFASADDKKAEIRLGKRKFLEDGSTRRSRRKVEHLNEVRDANDHDDCSVQDSSKRAIAEKFGPQNLNAGTCSKNGQSKRRILYLKPNCSSKAAESFSGRGFDDDQFSFSVIHLLSAVRNALIIPLQLGFGRDLNHNDQMMIRRNMPFLNIHDIVQCVRSKPGDPHLLQCQEPLIDLVRGVLKILSSETPPLGAVPWHPLTVYDRLRKRWQWIGPVPSSLNFTGMDVSCTAWGLSSENLSKLVGQFSVWLRRVQPALQLFASLPEPPLKLMQEMDFNTRFDNRKKLNIRTMSPICDEVRTYFHREEAIRYLIPDRSFIYTALDGQKSVVAPLRRDNYKTLSKSRGHHIFKDNRPPQFSLLSLVRDAAARLPGGLGTKTDICCLTRESQYIIDCIPEKDVEKIVSGALDRLQNEDDPSVAYIGRWGLWTYLHRGREVEDFV